MLMSIEAQTMGTCCILSSFQLWNILEEVGLPSSTSVQAVSLSLTLCQVFQDGLGEKSFCDCVTKILKEWGHWVEIILAPYSP